MSSGNFGWMAWIESRLNPTDAAVTYSTGVAAVFGGSRVYKRSAGNGYLRMTFNLTAGKVAGNPLMTVPTDYFPVAEFQDVIWNLSTNTPVTVSIRTTGEVVAQVSLTSGHNFGGSLAYPLAIT